MLIRQQNLMNNDARLGRLSRIVVILINNSPIDGTDLTVEIKFAWKSAASGLHGVRV